MLSAGCFSGVHGIVAAGLAAPFVARSSSLEIGAGLLQATLAPALHIRWFCLLAHSASNDICQCFSVSADGQWSHLFWIGVVSSEDTHFISPATHLLCHLIGIVVDHNSRQFDARCHGRHA